MLFRKKMPRSCTYCARATQIDEDRLLCIRRGVVMETDECRKFKYDPCKRIPIKPKAMDFRKYDDQDFSL